MKRSKYYLCSKLARMSFRFFLIILGCFFSCLGFCFTESTEPQTEVTDYKKLLTDYETHLNAGKYSFELYFNLGIAYGKTEQTAKSRLYLEKARKLKPNNRKLLDNLKIIEARAAQASIEPLPIFFVTKMSRYVAGVLSLNAWFVMVVASFGFLCSLVYFQNFTQRRFPPYLWITLTILVIMGLTFFGIRQTMLNDQSQAIVMDNSAIKSSPEEATEAFLTVNAGQKIELIEKVGEWYLVRLSNGLEGYLPETAFMRI